MSENEKLEWEDVSCEHIVNDEWIDFRKSRYRFPDGREFEPYYSYSRRDYVVIVATDEAGNYICVRQYRHGIKRVTTEFCAGGIERCDGKEYGSRLDKDSAEFVAEEYSRGHSFFTYISDTVDSLSSCCRLKNKVQTKEFNFTNGNMGVETGSVSVITLNLNRIIQDWCKSIGGIPKVGNQFDCLRLYLKEILNRIYKYHIAYKECLWDMYDSKLLPAYTEGFISLNKQI